MTIVDFTPVSAAIGGVCIGASAVCLLALNGKIAGMSGMIARLFTGTLGDRLWRSVFLIGLLAGAAIAFAAWDPSRVFRADAIALAGEQQWITLVVAGLLVGFGTRLGGGCTSGHGVCGMAAGSRRSIVAVLVFMGSGAAVVYLVRHILAGQIG